MAAILAIVTRLLGLVAELLGIATLIRGFAENSAQEHSPYLIEGIVTTAGLSIANPTYGLAAAHTEREAILAAIAALPAGSDIVIPDQSVNAEAVWSYMIGQQNPDGNVQNAMAEEWLYTLAHSLAIYSATEGIPDGIQPWYRLVFGGLSTAYSLGYTWSITGVARPADPDFTALLADDTVLSFMQRTQPAYSWVGIGPAGTATTGIAWKNVAGGPDGLWWRTGFQLPIVLPSPQPPIWPGIAGVTLGTTVPCAESTVLELPMDGLLILITSYPPSRSRWGAPPYLSVYHTGRLAFVSDNGDVEPFQYMGWTNALYTPQTMKRAAGVVIFLEPNVEAAATPWDITT